MTEGKDSINFGVLITWREPTNHVDDYYICVAKTFVYNAKNKLKVIYSNVLSAIVTVPHSDEPPQPIFH